MNCDNLCFEKFIISSVKCKRVMLFVVLLYYTLVSTVRSAVSLLILVISLFLSLLNLLPVRVPQPGSTHCKQAPLLSPSPSPHSAPAWTAALSRFHPSIPVPNHSQEEPPATQVERDQNSHGGQTSTEANKQRLDVPTREGHGWTMVTLLPPLPKSCEPVISPSLPLPDLRKTGFYYIFLLKGPL